MIPPSTEQRSSEEPYHRYVFDSTTGQFIGDFEAMYLAERTEGGFDSWHQSDPNLSRAVALAHVSDRRWKSILEAGCGKGYVAKELAAISGQVVGIDSSATALDTARNVAPNVSFEQWDLGDFPFGDRPSQPSCFLKFCRT